MHDEPRDPDAPVPGESGDPGDLTERHPTVPAEASVATTAHDAAAAAPATPASDATELDSPTWPSAAPAEPYGNPPAASYTPSPEPRADWARSWSESSPVTPERWYEPGPTGSSTAPVTATKRSGRRGGSLVIASVLSAVLASVGTVAALSAVGALDRPAPSTASAPQATSVGTVQPVAIDESSATIAVASKVSPAVVRITVTGTANVGNNGVIPETGVGSGVIFDSSGWILTNHHVVEGGEKFDVELKDGRVLSGSVYGIDTLTDLAIVKVDATNLPSAAIGESDALKVGQLVVAIGSPLGTYSNSVTSGIVSAKGRAITTDNNESLTNLIQTDAAINPGNSGGPLLDAGGNVVGINTAIAQNSNGIGFAIPIDIARPIMAQAVGGQPLSRPYMGIHFVSITRQIAETRKLPVNVGALVGGFDANGDPVTGVEAGKPADEGGVKDGDIIVSIDGKAIDEEHPLDATLAQFSPGDTVTVDVLRDGQHVSLQVKLGTRPAGL
ncbi:MAG: trypsin-like peptidase domain-containing protein [Chloroflexota bacterium]